MSHGLPPLLDAWADIIGVDLACKAGEQFGGRIVTVPKEPQRNHELVAVIGLEATRKLVHSWGTGKISVPKGPSARKERIKRMLIEGASWRDISIACDVTQRAVAYHASNLKERGLLNDSQPPTLPLGLPD